MPAKLLFRDAQGRDGAVELRMEPVYVGRAVECAVRTDDAMVSRKHSMIRFDQGRYWVEDLGSANGTHVNDVKVQRQALNHNDVVRCGSLWLRYVEDGPLFPAGPATPAPRQDLGFASTMASSLPPPIAPTPSGSMGSMGGMGSGGGMGGTPQFSNEEIQLLRRSSEDARRQFEEMRADRDKEVAENKRLRAENANMGQRLEDLKTQIKEGEEVIHAHKQLAEEIKQELDQIKEEHGNLTAKATQTAEDLSSRTRQLQRSTEDINKVKAEVDTHKKQVAELSKIKDDGFKKLNEQLAEVEHLREVIREQERILEERRVGLIGLEEGLKDLRREREDRIKETAQIRSERDELRMVENKRAAQMQGVNEENKRLSRLMADLQAGGTGGDSAEVIRLGKEMTNVQVELKRVETERKSLREKLDKAEDRAETLAGEMRRIQTEGEAGASDAKANEAAKQKADEARTKAETERTAAIKARDEAQKESAGLRAEVEQLRKRAADAEAAGVVKKDGAAEKRLEDAEKKNAELTASIEELNQRLKVTQSKTTASMAAVVDPTGLKAKASEVYQAINDVLNELKMNVSLVKDEFQVIADRDPNERTRTIKEAIAAAAGQTEDVKGVLRGLRELAEG